MIIYSVLQGVSYMPGTVVKKALHALSHLVSLTDDIYFYYPNFIDKSCRLRGKYIDLNLFLVVAKACVLDTELPACKFWKWNCYDPQRFRICIIILPIESLQHTSCHAIDLKRKVLLRKTLRLQVELSPFTSLFISQILKPAKWCSLGSSVHVSGPGFERN